MVSVKKFKIPETQIIEILKQADRGARPSTLCREHGICLSTFYRWRNRFCSSGGGSTGQSDNYLLERLKELEDENRRLKKMYVEERLKADAAQESMLKRW